MNTTVFQSQRFSEKDSRKKLYQYTALFLIALIVFIAGLLAVRNISQMADEKDHYALIVKILETKNFFTIGSSSVWGYHWTLVILSSMVQNSGSETIRLFSSLLGFLCFLSFFFLAKKINPDAAIQKSLLFLFFPVFFPFFFLIYTDIYSMFYVLLALWTALDRRLWFAGIFGILSIFVRQNNIIWLGLIALLVYFQDYYPQYRWRDIKRWIGKFTLFLVAALMVIAFAIWNKGFALGGSELHSPRLAPGNLFLCGFAFFFLFLPLHIANTPKIFNFLKRHYWMGAVLAVIFMIHAFSFHHHLTNDLARFFHNWVVIWMNIPTLTTKTATFLPMAYSLLSLCVTPLKRKSFYLLYPFTFLFLIILPLIEIRYSFIPYTLFLLFKEKDSERIILMTLAIYFVAIGCVMFSIIDGSFFP